MLAGRVVRVGLHGGNGLFRPILKPRLLWSYREIHRPTRQRPGCGGGLQVVPDDSIRRQVSGVFQKRNFSLESIPSILVPPVVFTGLLLALWAYKCLMTVIFQDKIIYMPYMPPFTRSEKLEDYAAGCKPVEWEERHIKSLDATKIALGIGRLQVKGDLDNKPGVRASIEEVVICYFHGNGGSVPPRLPMLSNVLKLVQSFQAGSRPVRYTLVALSYRGYWTSSGRASESGIKLDAQAMLQHVHSTYPGATIILWGQSLGAGVVCTAAAEQKVTSQIAGLVLETPFTSIKAMLIALYPQKWLPYQYLHPFLWNHWDSEKALRQIAEAQIPPRVLLLSATRDEVVPGGEIGKIEEACKNVGLETQRTDVIGSLHNEATTRREGQGAVARFVVDLVDKRE